jgi:TonB family protein
MKFRHVGFLLLVGCLAPHGMGQHFVSVMDGGKMSLVVAAQGLSPMVLRGGKPAVVHATKFALGEGGEYLPMFVAVRRPEVRTTSESMQGREINKEFHLYCELETAYSLRHVFVVIVLHLGNDSGLFLCEVGDLEPRSPKPFKVEVPMSMESELGNYELYMFSGGRELFHSMMGIGAMEFALNQMVWERIKGVEDAAAKPFLGPAPEYPAALFRKRVAGKAMVSFTIDERGVVGDPAVVRASQPEFGEASLVAIRQWRFLPLVRHGHPVQSRVEMPFEFAPPKGQ